MSQAELATRMGTSQAKIARIEGGEENVTLRTIKKIAEALNGRLALTLQPAEMQFLKLPNWWELPAEATVAWGSQAPVFQGMLTIQHGTGATIGARWDTTYQTASTQPSGGEALLAEADSGKTVSITYRITAVAEPIAPQPETPGVSASVSRLATVS